MGHYVGIDLHRRRSVIVVLDEDGEELWTRRFPDFISDVMLLLIFIGSFILGFLISLLIVKIIRRLTCKSQ